jgi:hypothetical protein
VLNGTSNFFCGAPAAAKASLGLFAIAAFIKSIHIGKAARAPVSFSPSVCRSSYPIHVPHVIDGENPMNHASVKSFVVPVFPPNGCFICEAATAVPCRTTACRSCIIVRAVSTEITSSTCTEPWSNGSPSACVTLRI